jgi:hypothetical protein
LFLSVAEFAPATAEHSLVGLGQQPSIVLSPTTPSAAAAAAAAGDGEGSSVSLQTFRTLLEKLMQQKSDIEGLLPAADVDIVRINAAALKQALIPWPVNRLAELHKALPVLAAGVVACYFCVAAARNKYAQGRQPCRSCQESSSVHIRRGIQPPEQQLCAVFWWKLVQALHVIGAFLPACRPAA